MEERGFPISLIPALGKRILEEDQPRPDDGFIHASDLGLALGHEKDGCQRAYWLMANGAERTPRTPGRSLMTNAGKLIHDYLPDLLGRALMFDSDWVVDGIEVPVEYEVDGIVVRGTYDVKLRNVVTGQTCIVDFKTKRGGAFRYLTEPKPGNKLQVQCYVEAEDADFGHLLYVDREGQNFMVEFGVERDTVAVKNAVHELDRIRHLTDPPPVIPLKLERKKNKGPDSLYLKLPWQIDWCDLKECACKAALPKLPPKGIVAKLEEKDGLTYVKPTDVGRPFRAEIARLLLATYPDETFAMWKEQTDGEG